MSYKIPRLLYMALGFDVKMSLESLDRYTKIRTSSSYIKSSILEGSLVILYGQLIGEFGINLPPSVLKVS